jgi:thiol:disulfide interchange protein DsbD
LAGTSKGAANSGPGAPLTMGLALLLAFGGGLLLNLMPCVFPVLSLKILRFVHHADHDSSLIRKHGFSFGAGVLVSFWVLAGSLLAFRAAGGGQGWGFQLQSPLFVAGLATLLFAVGLNLLGAFEVGVGLTALGGAKPGLSKGYGGSFASGVLATVVATPCTAPFMGAALGFALTQPAAGAMLVFTALGIGVALPYVLLSMHPAWLKILPKPGAWMETLKQFMAFPMFATALWLVWVFGLQTGVNGLAMLLGAFLLLGVAVWLLGRWKGGVARPVWLRTRALATVSVALAVLVLWKGAAEVPDEATAATAGGSAGRQALWQPYSEQKVAELQAAGKPVFVDFTAAWCITCQFNKKTTLARQEVLDEFARRGVTLMRADWTRRDPEIGRVLEGLGRSGVPVYALYEPQGAATAPRLLPEVLTEPAVLDALKELPEAGAPAGEAAPRQALRPTT